MSATQQVYAPTGAPQTVAVKSIERPRSLKDLRVGLLDNGKEFSDVVLESLAEVLRRDHGVTNIKFWRKGFPAKGARSAYGRPATPPGCRRSWRRCPWITG